MRISPSGFTSVGAAGVGADSVPERSIERAIEVAGAVAAFVVVLVVLVPFLVVATFLAGFFVVAASAPWTVPASATKDTATAPTALLVLTSDPLPNSLLGRTKRF